MAETGKWTRIKEAIDWGRRIHWLYLLLPISWKAYIVALCLGGVAVLLARLNNLTPAYWCMLGLITVAVTLIAWSVLEKRNPLPLPALVTEPSLKQRVLGLANELFAFLQKQDPEPPNPLSVKGSQQEQRRVFNEYFAWKRNVYYNYMAHYRDRVVKIDYELAAVGIFTKLTEKEINPPQASQEVDIKTIAETLLLMAHQLPPAQITSSTQHELDVTLDRVLIGTSLRANATIFLRVKLWAAKDLNIKKLHACIRVEGNTYETQPTLDLSEWILNEQVTDEHHRRTHRDTQMGSPHSLLTEIESGIFKAGHHLAKWVACELPLEYLGKEESITEVKLVFYGTEGILKTETFTAWPETTDRVIDADFRRA
jgi:hypothetical protein